MSRQRRQIGRQHESLVYPDTGEVGICCHPLPAAGTTSAVHVSQREQDVGHSEGSCLSNIRFGLTTGPSEGLMVLR